MKKKGKIILSCVLGAVVLGAIGTVVGLTLGNTEESISGAMVEGGGEYDWVRYEVYIPSETRDTNKYYTHCDGDYISNVYYIASDYGHSIEYDTWFSIFDDLETCFVLVSNKGERIVTDIETTHSPVGGDDVYMLDEDQYKSMWHIAEIWVKTVD